MKRKIVYVLGCFMLVGIMAGCGRNAVTTEEEKEVVYGVLSMGGATSEAFDNLVEGLPHDKKLSVRTEYFDDLNTLISALDSGKIDEMRIPLRTAEYLAKRNNTYEIGEREHLTIVPFSMMLKIGNEDLCKRINEAREALNKTGELTEIYNNMENDKPVEFETFEGAETITFAVTGDLPPMDYVSADGSPRGFNVQFIAAICKEMKVNVEIIQINSAARAMALATDKADVVFWTKGQIDDAFIEKAQDIISNKPNGAKETGLCALFNEDGTVNTMAIENSNKINKMDQPENTILTNPYNADILVKVVKR